MMREVKELQQRRAKPGVLSMTGEEGEERGTPGREPEEFPPSTINPRLKKGRGRRGGVITLTTRWSMTKKCGDDDEGGADERWTRGHAESNTLLLDARSCR